MQADSAKDCMCLSAMYYNRCSSYCNFLQVFFLLWLSHFHDGTILPVTLAGIKGKKVPGYGNGIQSF